MFLYYFLNSGYFLFAVQTYVESIIIPINDQNILDHVETLFQFLYNNRPRFTFIYPQLIILISVYKLQITLDLR